MNKNLYEDFNKDKKDILNAYSGTAVLIANGPSLQDVPDSFLNKYHTIGTNNIYLRGLEDISKYPDVHPKFVPTFYTILGIDQLNTEKKRSYCRPAIDRAELAFVNRMVYPHFDAPHVYAVHGVSWSSGHRPVPKERFSYDVTDHVGIGYTNTYIMFQILYHLGFEEVLCVGLDNDYSADPGQLHFYENDKRFACEPRMGRLAHQLGSNYVFGLAKQAFEKDGRKIININKKNNTPFESKEPEWN